ncbi:zinc finger, c3HC4 type (RING finger) domain-containing protein [Ditylenchus destructor]|uniref:Zinc finger, c3HC4 type (RING finger) domain-containing protein n=1 Tax=Ditylenchus destructor TaxID=166010 RepID=A0AAD4R0I0_9BILA|nr:zinc finger, c3HC4 type (RING finger) domain-containing protein [Ditylenchus destructor]
MEALDFDGSGVPGAVNGWTVSDDGLRAYLWDPSTDCVVRMGMEGGQRKALKWHKTGTDFSKRHWLCYCLFHVNCAFDEEDHLVCLLYNVQQQCYFFVAFCVTSDSISETKRFRIKIRNIKNQHLAYTAHKSDENVIQVVFYEWLESRQTEKLSVISPQRPHFVLCTLNCSVGGRMQMSKERCGVLPPQGRWQLPFVSDNKLHFIKLETNGTYLASLPLDTSHSTELISFISNDPESHGWEIRRTSYATLSDNGPPSNPPKKAIWCNAWRDDGGCFFVVISKLKSEPVDSAGGEVTEQRWLKLNIWHLGVENAQWTRLDAVLKLPGHASRFSLRLGKSRTQVQISPAKRDYSYANTQQIQENPQTVLTTDIYLHYDVDESRASLQKLQVKILKPIRGTHIYGNIVGNIDPENKNGLANVADVICPICLETYVDPRTLFCGHSLCFPCLVKMREVGEIGQQSGNAAGVGINLTKSHRTVKCPTCRKITKIPADGLPTNYGLQEAIESLAKQQIDLISSFVAQDGRNEVAASDPENACQESGFHRILDELLGKLRSDLTQQIEHNVIQNLRQYWTARYGEALRMGLPNESMEEITENQIQQLEQNLIEEFGALSAQVKTKTKTLTENFSRRIFYKGPKEESDCLRESSIASVVLPSNDPREEPQRQYSNLALQNHITV